MRIASLVPSGTEIAFALRLGDQVVAVTHDCDFPAAARTLPRLTRSTIKPDATSGEIDAAVRAAATREESTFHLDPQAMRDARPDVILGQTICRVCAVTIEQLPRASAPRVIPMSGEDLEGVLVDIRRIAEELGVPRRGAALEADLRRRLARVEERVAGAPRPAAAVLEWLDPPFNAGHWVPDQVRIAGARDALGRTGERSRVVTWDEIAGARPDVLVAALCGFGVQRALEDLALARAAPAGSGLPAVQNARVYAANGSAYFSRPGPRLVDGVEILASIFHPSLFAPPDPLAAVPAP